MFLASTEAVLRPRSDFKVAYESPRVGLFVCQVWSIQFIRQENKGTSGIWRTNLFVPICILLCRILQTTDCVQSTYMQVKYRLAMKLSASSRRPVCFMTSNLRFFKMNLSSVCILVQKYTNFSVKLFLKTVITYIHETEKRKRNTRNVNINKTKKTFSLKARAVYFRNFIKTNSTFFEEC